MCPTVSSPISLISARPRRSARPSRCRGCHCLRRHSGWAPALPACPRGPPPPAGDFNGWFFRPPEAAAGALALPAELRLPVTAIGTIERGGGVRLVDAAGKAVPIAAAGYRHF